MRSMLRPWCTFFLAALALFSWSATLFCVQLVGARSHGILIRFPEDGVSPVQLAQVERWAQEDGATISCEAVLWKEESAVTLTDETSAWTGTVLTLVGPGETIWPARFLWGGYPAQGDTVGLALDEAAAHALWGSLGILGSVVERNGTRYYLRGVFEGTEGLALIQGAEDDPQTYGNLLLRVPERGGRAAAEQWLLSNGISGGTIVDLPLWHWLLEAMTVLPSLLLGMGLVSRLLHRGCALRNAPVCFTSYLFPALVSAAVVFWAIGFPSDVPNRLLPSRWSDFSFWGKLGLMTEWQSWLAIPPGRLELSWWIPAVGCLVLTPTACGLTVHTAQRLEQGSLWSSLAVFGLIGLCIWAFSGLGGVALNRGILLMPLLWIWIGGGLNRHEAALRKEVHHETTQNMA